MSAIESTPKLQFKNVGSGREVEFIKVIFILLDFLDRWLREWRWQKETAVSVDDKYKKIKVPR